MVSLLLAVNFVTVDPGHFHAAHFGQVVEMYLGWMKSGREDPIYVDNMLVKYHTIVEAWKKAHGK